MVFGFLLGATVQLPGFMHSETRAVDVDDDGVMDHPVHEGGVMTGSPR